MNAKKKSVVLFQKVDVSINVTILSAHTFVHVIKDILWLQMKELVKVGKKEIPK